VVLPGAASVDKQIKAIIDLKGNSGAGIIVFNFNGDELSRWGKKFALIKQEGLVIIFQDNPMNSYQFGDVVINALPHPEYPGYNPGKHKSCYDGPEYLLFSEEFSEFDGGKRISGESPERILVAMGGADDKNISSMLLKILAGINCKAYIDVVLGPAYKTVSELSRMTGTLALNADVSVNVDNMAERIWKADIGFSALGLTTYEMASLNLPCLIISSNKLNSKSAEIYSDRYSMSVHAGFVDDLTNAELEDKVSSFVKDSDLHRKIQAMPTPFKGKGAYENILIRIKEYLID